MHTIKLTISSPDGIIYQDDVFGVSLRGTEGELAVLAGHVPFITSVKPGECKVFLSDDEEKIGYTDGGLLTVSPDKINLMAGGFKWKKSK